MDLISVIVPVFNVEKYLERCIESITNQTYKNLEIILVDDGSTDRSSRICDHYVGRDERIQVVHTHNHGLSAARNLGMSMAKGTYFAFVDSDDWLQEDCYEVLLSLLRESGTDIAAGSANVIEDEKKTRVQFQYFKEKTILSHEDALYKVLIDQIGSQVWFKLYRREVWNGIIFPEGYTYEDIAVMHLVFGNAENGISFTEQPIYNYRHNSDGISLSKNLRNTYCIHYAFKQRYHYTVKLFPAAAEKCLENAVTYGLGAVGLSLRGDWETREQDIRDVNDFLRKNRKEVMKLQWIGGVLRGDCESCRSFYFII